MVGTAFFAGLAVLAVLLSAAVPAMAAAAPAGAAVPAGVAVPAAAAAEPVQDAVAGLRDSTVYLDPGSGRNLDVDALRRTIGADPIKIAILPAGPGTSEVRTWPREISEQLPGNTVAVIAGRYFYAGSDVLCSGVAGQAATNAIARHNTELDTDDNSDLTAALTDFVAELKAAPPCASEGAGRGDRYADEPGGGEAFAGADTSTVLPWVLGGLGLGVLAIGGWVLLARRRAGGRVRQHRGEAGELVARLAGELARLPSGGPADGMLARTDATGKHGEAQVLLVGATTDVQYAAARHTAIEGLTAAAAARALLGGASGPPGDGQPPAIPAFDPPAGAVPAAVADLADLPHRPLPQYRPGAPYYHAGSAAAPAGWYPEPFWERAAEPAEPSGTPAP